MDRNRASWWAVVVCLLLSTQVRADPLVTRQLGELRTAAKCQDKASPWRPWCIATAWATGAAGTLPAGKVLVGMTVALEQNTPAKDALSHQVTFVALAIGKDGKAKLTDVNPNSVDEVKAVDEAIVATSAVFKGRAATAKLPKDLADYVRTLEGSYATTKQDNAWTWTGASASQLRKVGKFWVVIEVPPARNGVWATILTDAWE